MTKTSEEKTVKLDLGIMAGAESKAWLAGFTQQNDRLEKLIAKLEKASGKAPLKVKPEEDEEADETETSDDDDEDFAAKPVKTAKKKAAFDDDDDEAEKESEDEDDANADDESEAGADDEGEEEPPVPPTKTKAKPAKTKKLSVDDVNDACKARARAGGKNGRLEVLAILKKKFKTESVSELEPEQWQACIDAMKVEE